MKRLLTILLVFCSLLYAAQEPVSVALAGTVLDKDGYPVEGVTITLAGVDNLSAETVANGTFTLTNVTGVVPPENFTMTYGISIKNNTVVFSTVPEKISGTISLFSGNGRRIFSSSLDNLHAGQQHIALPRLSSGIYLLSGSVNGETFSRSLVCVGDNVYMKNKITGTSNTGRSLSLNKLTAAAVNDTLIAAKEGYDTTRYPLTSYTAGDIDIVLKEEGQGGEFTITSTAFEEGDEMPDVYTCEGKSMGGGIAPPLEWSGIPEEAKSLALFFKDLTAAAGLTPSMGYHWGMWNIPITVTGMPEGLGGDTKPAEMGGAEQKSAYSMGGGNKFFGPCPDYQSKGGIKDTYAFLLFAFNTETISPPSDLMQMAKFFEDHAIDSTSLSVWSDAQP